LLSRDEVVQADSNRSLIANPHAKVLMLWCFRCRMVQGQFDLHGTGKVKRETGRILFECQPVLPPQRST